MAGTRLRPWGYGAAGSLGHDGMGETATNLGFRPRPEPCQAA